MEKYVENYGVYHHKLTGGGKFGESVSFLLLKGAQLF